MSDARGASGFSFGDLAADFAGVALAKQMLQDKDSGDRLLRALAESFQGVIQDSHRPSPIVNLFCREFVQRFDLITGLWFHSIQREDCAATSAFLPVCAVPFRRQVVRHRTVAFFPGRTCLFSATLGCFCGGFFHINTVFPTPYDPQGLRWYSLFCSLVPFAFSSRCKHPKKFFVRKF